MARVWMSGFEGGSIDVLDFHFGGTEISTDTPGDWSGFSVASFYPGYAGLVLPTALSELFVRFAFKPQALGTLGQVGVVMYFADDTGAVTSYLYWNGAILEAFIADGILTGPDFDTSLGACGTIPANGWSLIEIHLTSSLFEVRVEEAERLSFSGTTGGGSTQFLYWQPTNANSAGFLHDDLAVNDSTGTVNNDWIGDGGIVGLYPNGVGDTTQWDVVGAAANWQAEDDAPPDDDTTYITSDTTDDIDLYTLDQLEPIFTVVNAVAHRWRGMKAAPGTRAIRPLLKEGTTDTGAAIGITSGWRTHATVYDINPITAVAWDEADFDTIQAGVKLV